MDEWRALVGCNVSLGSPCAGPDLIDRETTLRTRGRDVPAEPPPHDKRGTAERADLIDRDETDALHHEQDTQCRDEEPAANVGEHHRDQQARPEQPPRDPAASLPATDALERHARG